MKRVMFDVIHDAGSYLASKREDHQFSTGGFVWSWDEYDMYAPWPKGLKQLEHTDDVLQQLKLALLKEGQELCGSAVQLGSWEFFGDPLTQVYALLRRVRACLEDA